MSRWIMTHGEAFGWLRGLPSASVDAVITDPPYSSGGAVRGDRMNGTSTKYVSSNTKDTDEGFTGDNRDQRGYLAWCTVWLAECQRVVKPGGMICLFTDWRQLPVTTDAIQCGGFVWRGIVPWIKPNPRPQMGRFAAAAEYVVWGSNGPMASREEVGCRPGYFLHQQSRGDRHHQTGKPTPVMRDIVKICDPGGLIIDPFSGSATTGVAALIEGYKFAGCEMSEHYHRIAVERLTAAEAGVQVSREDTMPGGQQGGLFGTGYDVGRAGGDRER